MEPLVLSPSETAKALKLSNNEVSNLLAMGELPGYRDGRNWKIPVSLLRKWVEEKALSEAAARRGDGEEKEA